MYVVKNNTGGEVTLYYKEPKLKDDHYLSQDGRYFNIDPKLIPVEKCNEPVEVVILTKEDYERLRYKASQAPTVPYMGG